MLFPGLNLDKKIEPGEALAMARTRGGRILDSTALPVPPECWPDALASPLMPCLWVGNPQGGRLVPIPSFSNDCERTARGSAFVVV